MANKHGKAVAIWDIGTGLPGEEILAVSLKELIAVLVDLSLESVMSLALISPVSKRQAQSIGQSQA